MIAPAPSALPGPAAVGTPQPAATGPADARLHQAAVAFEAIFVRQMLGAAHAGAFADTLLGNDPGRETFAAMRDERFADLTAQSGALGLAHSIVVQLGARA